MDLIKLLEGTLDDLDIKDLKNFKWHLKNLTEAVDGFPNISNNKLPGTADSQDTVDVMVTRYESPEEARKVAVIVLRKMNNNNLAKKLEDSAPQFTGGSPWLHVKAASQEEDPCRVGKEALAEVFSQMKFRVVMCKDKTAVEIPIVLKVFSELKQLSDLQPHGKKEGVCATDGTVVPTIDILSPFNGEKCTILVGKPKVFFIQACRGGGGGGVQFQVPDRK
eukprot:XP_013996349.1 PREDICTED: caspase-8-like [Salmo salar]